MEIVLAAASAFFFSLGDAFGIALDVAALEVMFAGLVVLAGAEGARAEPSASSAGGG
jgi:hypothetical protein